MSPPTMAKAPPGCGSRGRGGTGAKLCRVIACGGMVGGQGGRGAIASNMSFVVTHMVPNTRSIAAERVHSLSMAGFAKSSRRGVAAVAQERHAVRWSRASLPFSARRSRRAPPAATTRLEGSSSPPAVDKNDHPAGDTLTTYRRASPPAKDGRPLVPNPQGGRLEVKEVKAMHAPDGSSCYGLSSLACRGMVITHYAAIPPQATFFKDTVVCSAAVKHSRQINIEGETKLAETRAAHLCATSECQAYLLLMNPHRAPQPTDKRNETAKKDRG